MNTAAYVQNQLQSFTLEWNTTGVFLAGVRSSAALGQRMVGSKLLSQLPKMPGERQVPTENALVVGAGTSWPELWIRPDYSGYEGVFAKFAKWHADYDYLKAPEKSKFDVDHVFSHTRAGPAQLGISHVRLGLVDRGANRSWGSFVEKTMVESDAMHQGKTHHYATLFLLAKLVGLNAPSKNNYIGDIRSLARRLIQMGFGKPAEYDLFVFQMQYLYEVEVLQIEPTKTSFP